MTTRLATTTLMACLAGALLLGGCGSSDKGRPIPTATRAELEKQLTSIERRFDFGGAGACSDIGQNQTSVEATLASLPRNVDAQVRNGLRQGFDRLFELTATQCDEQKGQQTETQPTESAPPAPTETQTMPTTPTQTETTPQKQQKPKKGKGNGKGNGNGNGGAVPESGVGGGVPAPGGD